MIDLAAYRRGPAPERQLETEWEQLLKVAWEAWTWRDPESVEGVEACVAHLKDAVRREWESD